MTASASESHIRHGTKVGRFVVVAELGSGGMGIVYAAHDRELDRQVALKVMRVASVEEEDRVRMLREGQAMARITHPNVITVFEVGTDDGVVFLAQELLDGGTLGEWLEQPHSQAAILDKFIAAGRGLAAAHAVGLVHRDFKPDNVLLGKDGRVRVADFGLAREVGASAPDAALLATAPARPGQDRPQEDRPVALSQNLTRTGVVMGTPMFMAPEQHEGRPADERSDQFAFCVALYHALYGDYPFDGKTAIALADNVINGVMKKPPAGAKVPARLREIMLRGLSIKPGDRFASMNALLAELAKPPAKASKIWFILAGVIVMAAGAAASIALLSREPTRTSQPTTGPGPIEKGAERDVDPSALSAALDLGQLESARKKLDDDVLFMQDKDKIARAKSAAAFMLVLAGDLDAAKAKLDEAAKPEPADPASIAYLDMAASAISSARGDLKAALERSDECVYGLGGKDPIAGSICYQIQGDAHADRGDAAAARKAYAAGLDLAKKAKDTQRISELSLAIGQLDLDEKQEDVSLDAIAKLQKDARRRGAVSCEATAAVLGARIRLTKADQQGALDVFEDINPDVLQSYRTKMIAKITLGQVYGYRAEADEDGVMGLARIDEVIADAQKRGFVGLVLEARLARVLVKLVTATPDAESERAALITDAKAKGYQRIAKLAAVDLSVPHDPMPAESPPQ